MKDLAGKLTSEGDLVIDLCAGSCLTVQACVPLDQQRKFSGCHLDSDILSAANPDNFHISYNFITQHSLRIFYFLLSLSRVELTTYELPLDIGISALLLLLPLLAASRLMA